jgi:heavy metal sensor kinase
LWYIALLALILIAFSGALYFTLARALYQQVDDSLAVNANQLISALNIENGHLDVSGDASGGDEWNTLRARGYAVRLLDSRGSVINPSSGDTALPFSAQNGATNFQTVSLNGEPYRVYASPIQDNGQLLGTLQIAQSLESVETALRQLVLALALIIPLTLMLATFGGMWFARRALAPIDDITRAAQRISAQDLHQRLNLNLPNDEVGRLARTFDAMLARLDDAFRREREFTDNASHELRTPLTVMRGEIDVALQRPRERAEYERVLGSLGADVEQLTRTAEDLLMLARADAQQLALSNEALNALELLQVVSDELQPIADARHITLDVGADPALAFWGDEQKMLRVLLNLVDNALKFSTPDTRVSLTASREGERVVMRVGDQGPGIPPDALPHIFDRFYRGTNGRASGAGLGLAIARALVEAQGGTITVESAVGQGTTFTIYMRSTKL